ncbi:diaminopimelate epimerase [Thermodesulfobacteriota bacterium]
MADERGGRLGGAMEIVDGLEFWKMSGSGNDFILIDDRRGSMTSEGWSHIAERTCRRGASVGADGMIVVQASQSADFSWIFLNADGSEAEMCGNGARCVARFAFLKGFAGESLCFSGRVGIINARVMGSSVRVDMPDPTGPRPEAGLTVDGGAFMVNDMDTGVPHAVVFVSSTDAMDVESIGQQIRWNERYAPKGTNVDFVEVMGGNLIRLRTFERGVEAETLACGTGAVAAALVSASKDLTKLPSEVETRSGEKLTVDAGGRNGGRYERVTLEGGTRVAYVGRLHAESFAASQ